MARQLTTIELEKISKALVSARETNLGMEVQMPVVYPNGQCVSVVVNVVGDNYVVHDAGFGSMALAVAGVDSTRALAQKFARIAKEYGCEFVGGRMTRACTEVQLPFAIALVANASRIVADQYWHREKKTRDFRREVSLVLARELPEDRVRKLQVLGDSGTVYKVSHAVLSKDKDRELAFLEPIADQQSVDRKFREFSDIRSSESYEDVQRISVYDDSSEWRDGDLAVLARVSNVVPFSSFPFRLKKLMASY